MKDEAREKAREEAIKKLEDAARTSRPSRCPSSVAPKTSLAAGFEPAQASRSPSPKTMTERKAEDDKAPAERLVP